MLPQPAPHPPEFNECPVGECLNTEDLMVQECSPGYTWVFTSTVCGHVAWVYWQPAEGFKKERVT